jgi:transposase
MLTCGELFLHDNALPHTAAHTLELLEHFNWELFDHPPYSPNLAPSVYHLFTYLENWLGSQSFNNNEELMEGVKTWLSSQAANFFDASLKNLFPDMTSSSIPAVIVLRSS